ncbi:MAG: PAS domain S-box protein [Bacteroidia bacterium]
MAKGKKTSALIITSKELAFQNQEKRANEVINANKALAASENRYRRLFEAAQDGILILNADTGVIEDVNPFMIEMLGYSHTEFLGKQLWEIGLFSDIIANKEAFFKLKEEGYIRYKDLPLKTKNGRAISVEFVSNRYDVSGGQVIQCNIRNITERKIAEENNKRLTERLLLATQSAKLGIWDWDIKNNILKWDEGMYLIYDIDEVEFESIDEGWLSRVHPEDIEWVNQAIQQALVGKEDYHSTYRLVWKDSSVHYIEASGIIERDAQGNAIRMIGANWDITSQKEKERHLKLLESVITHTNDSVMITEAEPFDEPGHKILYVNEAFTIMSGYSSEEVIGKTPRILQGPKSDKIELQRLGKAIRKWHAFETTIINYKKNGEEFWINFTLTPVANEKGWYTHWIAIERDVTAQKLAEIHLNELNKNLQKTVNKLANANVEQEKLTNDIIQRNQDLEQFTFIISHNLRAPAANIIGLAEILQEETLKPEEQKEVLKGLSSSISGLDAVIKDINSILQIKREVNDKKELISFSTLVNDILISIRNPIDINHVRIRSDFSEVDEIFSLKVYMYSIFHNLISNSIKYRKPNEQPLIEIKSKKEDGKIILTFKDNGLGIDMKTKGDKVFGLYKRFHSHVEGKGMGLFMVKTQVEAIGGTISLTSEPNKGTEFKITLIN